MPPISFHVADIEIYQYVQSAASGQSLKALKREVPCPGVKESEPERTVCLWEFPQDLVHGFFCFTGVVMKFFTRIIPSGYSLFQGVNGRPMFVREVIVGEVCFCGNQW